MILLTVDLDATAVLVYIIIFIFGLLITYFFFRWLFAVDKRVNQNDSIINLLKLIAKKHGATDDEIHNASTQIK